MQMTLEFMDLLLKLFRCEKMQSVDLLKAIQESRDSAGRTARCRWKVRHVSNYTTASCGLSATAPLSCWSLSSDCSESSVNNPAWDCLSPYINVGFISKVSEEVAT